MVKKNKHKICQTILIYQTYIYVLISKTKTKFYSCMSELYLTIILHHKPMQIKRKNLARL